MRVGYLVEYSKRKGLFEDFEDREKLICSDGKLIELLQHKLKGTVWSARWIDIEEYQENHKDENLRILE